MTKVKIARYQDGWRYHTPDMRSEQFASYPAVVSAAKSGGHTIDNGGWIHRLLMWNFNSHAVDGYPTWEIETDGAPAFVKLAHKRRRDGDAVESHALAVEWDDIAEVDFYQRDWTDDGLPFVKEGATYWSGWWFATIAERNRFVKWYEKRRGA